MSASLNQVTLIGNLGSDPELRFTPSQKPVANFSLATNEYRKDDKGERHDHTEWHRIVVWGQQAEACQKFLHKGSQVAILGRLQSSKWTGKDGQHRQNVDIVAHQVLFLDKGPPKTTASQPSGDLPFDEPAF